MKQVKSEVEHIEKKIIVITKACLSHEYTSLELCVREGVTLVIYFYENRKEIRFPILILPANVSYEYEQNRFSGEVGITEEYLHLIKVLEIDTDVDARTNLMEINEFLKEIGGFVGKQLGIYKKVTTTVETLNRFGSPKNILYLV